MRTGDKMKHKKPLTLKYLNEKINRLKQEFRNWERIRLKWENERDERLKKLEILK